MTEYLLHQSLPMIAQILLQKPLQELTVELNWADLLHDHGLCIRQYVNYGVSFVFLFFFRDTSFSETFERGGVKTNRYCEFVCVNDALMTIK